MYCKKSWTLVAGVACLLCACACGGGGSEAEPAQEAPAQQAQERAIPAAAETPRYEGMSVEQLQAWVADHPDDVDGLHALGIALHQAGNVEESLRYFEKCAELVPSERHWVELGAIYFLLERMDDAESLFHKALEASPRSGPALFHLGNVAQSRGDSAQAVSFYTQAVEAEPNYLIAYFRLAELHRANGEATEAYAAYEAVLGCEPSGPGDLVLFDRSMLQMAALDIQHGAAERATKLLDLLIAEEPRHAQAHYLMAQAWNALGRAEDAQRELAIHNEIVGAAGDAPPTP